jgi:hypothetical protein
MIFQAKQKGEFTAVRQSMNQFFNTTRQNVKKFRSHFLILACLIIYLLVAPVVYRALLIKVGVPYNYDGDLPQASNTITMAIDSFDTVTQEGNLTRDLEGWAYLNDEPDQSGFQKLIVLESDSRVYYFQTSPVKRTALNATFSSLGLDLLYAGFRAFISEEHVKPGEYHVGILFIDESNNLSYFSRSSSLIHRTPNSIVLETNENESAFKENIFRGDEINFDQSRQEPTTKIMTYVDGFTLESHDGIDAMRLNGWAFLQEDQNQSLYERFVVFHSEQGNLYFPVTVVERPDVQDAFDSLGLDLQLAGFTTLIAKDGLTDESYQIGVLFQHKLDQSVIYAISDWIISLRSGQLVLERTH